MKRSLLFWMAGLFPITLGSLSWAQNLNVIPLFTQSPSVLVQNLMGLGVSYSNVTYKGTAWSSGTFSGGSGIIGFDSGIILSNGKATSVVGPNGSLASTCNNIPGDQDLANLAGVALSDTYDATVLSFDFVPSYNNITFQYVFASDEYNQYVGSAYNDVFAFFINGVNAALIPGTGTAVATNNVNACQNSSYFINNSTQITNLGACSLTLPSSNLNTSMNGMTTVLTVNTAVNPGVTNHIKLAICDVGDCVLDSNVFIQAKSFSSGPTATPTNTPVPTATFTPTLTETPCGYPGNTCTPSATPTVTPTPVYADVFYVSKNLFVSSDSVSIFVDYTKIPGDYGLYIYNSAGEHIKTLDSQHLTAPISQSYHWDGTNKNGNTCASGVYILYLIEPFDRKIKKVLFLH